MKIAVIGGTGMIGRELVGELASRGHLVSAIARNIDGITPADGVTAVQGDIYDYHRLPDLLAGHDAVVSAFSPGHGIGPAIYKGVVEAGWRIIRAFRQAEGRYLINIGGASSLWTERGVQMFEDPQWPRWYFNTASLEHLDYLRQVTGRDLFERMRDLRREILETPGADPYSDWDDAEVNSFMRTIANNHDIGAGGRAQFALFENDSTFAWSFASPPWFLRPGERTGQYRTTIDQLPLDGDKPAGISVADFAFAVADEAENQKFKWQHWSAASAG